MKLRLFIFLLSCTLANTRREEPRVRAADDGLKIIGLRIIGLKIIGVKIIGVKIIGLKIIGLKISEMRS